MEILLNMNWIYITLTWVLISFGYAQESVSQANEFCQWETFHAKCDHDHVITMESAMYGRLRPGRCVKRQYGYIGCSADVMAYMDSRCSGRRSCNVTVADIALQGVRPCPGDLTSFLVATYTCVKVPLNIMGHGSTCNLDQPVILFSQEGYLPSVDKDCSFVLSAPEGQRFNLSLLDFGIKKKADTPGRMYCQRYATVRDRNHQQWLNVCGNSGVRLKEVFISESNEVEIRLLPVQKDHSFLLYYKVFGCAAPTLPPYMQLERSGDRAVVSCPHVRIGTQVPVWNLRCSNGDWMGEYGNCSNLASSSSAVHADVWDQLARDWSTPTGLSLVVTLGLLLGTVIGGMALAFAYVCIKREHLCHNVKNPPIYLDPIKPSSDPSMGGALQASTPGTILDQEDYADIWLPGGGIGDDGQVSSGYRTLSADTGATNTNTSGRADSTCSPGSCVVHGSTGLSESVSPPVLRVSTRSSPSPRQVFRDISGGKDGGNMYSYGALEPGWGVWREQVSDDGQRSTSILV